MPLVTAHRASCLTVPAFATGGNVRTARGRYAVQAVQCRADASDPAKFWIDCARKAAVTTAVAATLTLAAGPSLAELNKFEYNAGGEFGVGTAQQYGEADLKGRDFSKQDLTRSNFTAADCRSCNFTDSKLTAAYFIKTVLFKANFQGAQLSDSLMDRAVLNEANLTNAVLERVVLTRSDLTGAIIEGADFSNSLIDREQQIALCRYADGVNPTTGVDTRKSLGCGSKRKFRAQSPSSPDGPQVSDDEKESYKKSLPAYQQ